MARVYGIKKKLMQNGIDEKIIKEIVGNEDLVDVIVRMEKLLDPNLMHEILDSCACRGGQDFLKKCEKIGKDLTNRSLDEKAEYLNNNFFILKKLSSKRTICW